jgi:toxin ParE1/3/4
VIPVALHSAAFEELQEAVLFYEERSPGLGVELVAEVERGLRALCELPEQGSAQSGVRRFVLRRFPFTLVYNISAERVTVLAVMHQRRRPGYWKPRLRG